MYPPKALKIWMGNDIKYQRVVDCNKAINGIVYYFLHRDKDNGVTSILSEKVVSNRFYVVSCR